MAELVYADSFIEDMQSVELETKRDEIFKRIDLLAEFPDLGSANMPASIARRFGHGVRKLIIDPFDVIYEYAEKTDSVHVLGLVHQRAAK